MFLEQRELMEAGRRFSLDRFGRIFVGVMLLSLAAIAGCQVIGARTNTPLSGRVVWPKDGDLWVIDLASKQQQKITNLPAGAAITGATWAPDGARVAYAQFWRRPNERQSGSDIFTAKADGSDARVFADRDAPNSVFEAPVWAQTGRIYYTARRVQNGREAVSIMRQSDGAAPETAVEDAEKPSISADESTLVYVHSTRGGQELRKRDLGESSTDCVLIPDTLFQIIALPRITPNGSRVAFGGQGNPATQPSGTCGNSSSRSPAATWAMLPALAAQLGVGISTAYAAPAAHGAPSDVWTINLDGTGFGRLAELKEDEPTVTWSPDGAHLAVFGVAALYVADSKVGAVQKIVDQGGYGGLDWHK